MNISMIAGGVAAVIFFRGFSLSQVTELENSLIKSDLGHLVLAKKIAWERTNQGMKNGLITNFQEMSNRFRSDSEVQSISGRVSFYGLLGTGEKSIAARAIAFDPDLEASVLKTYFYPSGRALGVDSKPETVLGYGIAKQLNAKVGDSITIIANTVDNVMNALDVEVVGVFHNGVEIIDDTTFLIPLKTAQTLLNTDAVERIVVTLKDTKQTDEALSRFNSQLESSGSDLQFRPWYSLSKVYKDVTSFYKVYNAVIEFIILTIVVIGILNTIGMSIFERMGEIGTLRALGETRKKIIGQFVLEGAVLGVLGAVVGVLGGLLSRSALKVLQIPIELPMTSKPFPVQVVLNPRLVLSAVFMAFLAALLASFIPSVRAARMNIVEALKRNI